MWHERPENAGKVERLRKMFKNTPNDVIMEKLDISFSTLHRAARALGLTKTKRFMRRCQRDAAAKARNSHIVNGTYPPKGYIIPGSERYRFKAGETPLQRLGARKERTEALQSYADDIVRLLILYYSRVDGSPDGMEKRARIHRAVANFRAVPGFDAEALIRFFKMR